MPLSSTTKDSLLNSLSVTHASLHDGFPGTTGSNEITGVTRQPIVVNASSGGIRALNAAVVFSVPACTVRWIGYWNNAVFVCPAVNGGATPKNYMALPLTNIVYSTGHGWSDGQKIAFFGVAPSGITEGGIYYVRDSQTDTFKIAGTLSGDAIDFMTAGSAGSWVLAITETVYAAADTHALTATNFVFPD